MSHSKFNKAKFIHEAIYQTKTIGDCITGMMYADYAERLIDHMRSIGLRVKFTTTQRTHALIMKDQGTSIIVNVSEPITKIVHLLIHELGHVSIGYKSSSRWSKGYSWISTLPGGEIIPPREFLIDVLDEEISAWWIGKEEAHKLGIRPIEDLFNRERILNVSTYVHWASSGIDWIEQDEQAEA